MLGENTEAKTFAPVEVATRLRPVFVNGAQKRGWIEGDTGAVALLVHATNSIVLHDQRFRHHVTGSQFHHQVATAAATGARRNVCVSDDALQDGMPVDDWRCFPFTG